MQKTKIQKRKPKPADALLKTSKKKDIELTEQQLGKVAGGVKVPVEYKEHKID